MVFKKLNYYVVFSTWGIAHSTNPHPIVNLLFDYPTFFVFLFLVLDCRDLTCHQNFIFLIWKSQVLLEEKLTNY